MYPQPSRNLIERDSSGGWRGGVERRGGEEGWRGRVKRRSGEDNERRKMYTTILEHPDLVGVSD